MSVYREGAQDRPTGSVYRDLAWEDPYSDRPAPSWWQRLKCRFGWCFKALCWIERTECCDIWHQGCPYCGATEDAVDDPL